MKMKAQVTKTIIYLVLGFVILFCLRLGYGYRYADAATNSNVSTYTDSFEFSKKNYASSKMNFDGQSQQVPTVDQKYEKIASLGSQSGLFDEDEKKLRDLTTAHNALIQYEQNTGLPGNRKLNLAIGVPPRNFDAMVTKVKEIGKIVSLRVDKTDKTNEYKDLNAKKVSLEKTREGLIALKSKGGSIDESINLENRILEIESELQMLGVSLGEFDKENEFCTVKVTLAEGVLAKTGIPFVQRVKVAFEWTVKFYLMVILILLGIVGVAFLGTNVFERIKSYQNGTTKPQAQSVETPIR